MRTTYFWEAYCLEERFKGIHDVEEAVNRYGTIMDFHRFSDMSLSLTIEIEAKNIGPLLNELTSLMEVKTKQLKSDSSFVWQGTYQPQTNDPKLCSIYLSVDFAQGKGDLKIEVPAVPGS